MNTYLLLPAHSQYLFLLPSGSGRAYSRTLIYGKAFFGIKSLNLLFSIRCCTAPLRGRVAYIGENFTTICWGKIQFRRYFPFCLAVLDRWLKMSVSDTGAEDYGMPEFTAEPSVGVGGRPDWRICDRSCLHHKLNNATPLICPSFLWQPVHALLLDLSTIKSSFTLKSVLSSLCHISPLWSRLPAPLIEGRSRFTRSTRTPKGGVFPPFHIACFLTHLSETVLCIGCGL